MYDSWLFLWSWYYSRSSSFFICLHCMQYHYHQWCELITLFFYLLHIHCSIILNVSWDARSPLFFYFSGFFFTIVCVWLLVLWGLRIVWQERSVCIFLVCDESMEFWSSLFKVKTCSGLTYQCIEACSTSVYYVL